MFCTGRGLLKRHVLANTSLDKSWYVSTAFVVCMHLLLALSMP